MCLSRVRWLSGSCRFQGCAGNQEEALWTGLGWEGHGSVQAEVPWPGGPPGAPVLAPPLAVLRCSDGTDGTGHMAKGLRKLPHPGPEPWEPTLGHLVWLLLRCDGGAHRDEVAGEQ